MTVAVVVHVDADRPYVDSLRENLEGVRLVACAVQPKSPIMAFDQRLTLLLVWSKQAAQAQAAAGFAAMARAHHGETLVCAADETPLPAALTRLGATIVDAGLRSSFFPRGLLAALADADLRQLNALATTSVRASEAGNRRAFTEGVARGLAGSVAVFGVSGAAALGMEQFIEVNGAVADPMFVAEAPANLALPSTFEDAATAEETGAWAEAEVIYVDPSLRDVPLAQPSEEDVARVQRAAFRSDTPLETVPSDAEVVAALNRVETLRITELMVDETAPALMGISDDGGAIVGPAPTI